MRLLVLVLASDGEYEALSQAIRDSWGKNSDRLHVLHYYHLRSGKWPRPPRGQVVQQDDCLLTGWPGGLPSALGETLDVFRWLCQVDLMPAGGFNYVLRCCSGSYYVVNRLLAWLEDKPRENFYAGALGTFGDPQFRYASGSGMLLSRDLIKPIVDNAHVILHGPDPGYHDDVAIGRFLHAMGVQVVSAPRVNPDQIEIFLNEPSLRDDQFHWHVGKSVELMKKCHSVLG